MRTYDVVIIGAGVIGSAIARELSRFQIKTAVLERASDVCEGASKANSGIVHAGHDAVPGSLKAKLNVQGSRMMPELTRMLDIPFRQNGAMVVCLHEQDLPQLQKLYERGIQNGVQDLRILSKKEALALEPNLSDETAGALLIPSSGIVCPFQLTVAFAENASCNGVEFHLNTEVKEIERISGGYRITCTQDMEEPEKPAVFEAACVINAAGVYAADIHHMICEKEMRIVPRRGEYCLLDVSAGRHVERTIFRVPGVFGKGILVTPTVHGNLLVGPTAEDMEDPEGINTTAAGMKRVNSASESAVKNVPMHEVITSFAGLRAHEESGDFIIEEAAGCPGFIDVAGIASPGLSASPAIGLMVANMVKERLNPALNESFVKTRRGIVSVHSLPFEERAALIERHPSYGNIICRCSMVSEGEILDAIHRPLGATTMDGVKRRVRPGMGRCQGGFCAPRVMELLSRELQIPMEQLTKCGKGSELIAGKNGELSETAVLS
ncbi:MAG: NAD(P)/FAD-dependent oxidoreductase [Lachnospiraceae bacterium]